MNCEKFKVIEVVVHLQEISRTRLNISAGSLEIWEKLSLATRKEESFYLPGATAGPRFGASAAAAAPAGGAGEPARPRRRERFNRRPARG